jgi:hypothetical protein
MSSYTGADSVDNNYYGFAKKTSSDGFHEFDRTSGLNVPLLEQGANTDSNTSDYTSDRGNYYLKR